MYNTAAQLKQTHKTLVLNEGMRKRICTGMIVGVAILSALYIFFLASTTMHIAERKDIQSDIRATHTRIADLEADFFAQANGIDLAYAAERGFSETKSIIYQERGVPTESFAFHVE